MITLSWSAHRLIPGAIALSPTIPEDGPMRIPTTILAIVICVLGLGSLLIGASESVSRRASQHFGFDEEPGEQGRIRRRRRTRRR
jgi:hypothetical protein